MSIKSFFGNHPKSAGILFTPKKTFTVDKKPVFVLDNRNVPKKRVLQKVYSGINDDRRIPVVVQNKEQYLKEYIHNQEAKKKITFSPLQKQQYIKNEKERMGPVIARYTTRKNRFIEPRVVVFTDTKLSDKELEETLNHEYAHELWEKNKKIKKDWRSVNKDTAPTEYGKTDREEDFADSFAKAKEGSLEDEKRKAIIDRYSKDNWSGNYAYRADSKRRIPVLKEKGLIGNTPQEVFDIHKEMTLEERKKHALENPENWKDDRNQDWSNRTEQTWGVDYQDEQGKIVKQRTKGARVYFTPEKAEYEGDIKIRVPIEVIKEHARGKKIHEDVGIPGEFFINGRGNISPEHIEIQKDDKWIPIKEYDETSPTMYGRTDREEDFADSFAKNKEGTLEDQKRKMIIDKYSHDKWIQDPQVSSMRYKYKMVNPNDLVPVETEEKGFFKSEKKIKSIKESGPIREPVVVSNKVAHPGEWDNEGTRQPPADKYLIINGHHRTLAAIERGDTEIPVEILDTPKQTISWRKEKGLLDEESKDMAVFTPEQEKEIQDIDWNKDQKGKQLGQGFFGIVHEVKDNPKYILKSPLNNDIREIQREARKYEEFKNMDIVAPTVNTSQGLVREKMRIITRGSLKNDDFTNQKSRTLFVEDKNITDDQVKDIVKGVNQLTENEINIGDDLQIGIAPNNKPYIFDLGEMHKTTDSSWEVHDENDQRKKKFLEGIDKEQFYDRDHKKEYEDAITELTNPKPDEQKKDDIMRDNTKPKERKSSIFYNMHVNTLNSLLNQAKEQGLEIDFEAIKHDANEQEFIDSVHSLYGTKLLSRDEINNAKALVLEQQRIQKLNKRYKPTLEAKEKRNTEEKIKDYENSPEFQSDIEENETNKKRDAPIDFSEAPKPKPKPKEWVDITEEKYVEPQEEKYSNISEDKWIDIDSYAQNKFTPNRQGYTEASAARRFGGVNLARLKYLGQGRDRKVYALDDDKVIKIAKNPGGLSQNEKEIILDEVGHVKHFETGKDYAVMERVPKIHSEEAKEKWKAVQEAAYKANFHGGYDKHPDVKRADFVNSPEFDKTGWDSDIGNYDFNTNELATKAQFGEKPGGELVIVDAGIFSRPGELSSYRIKDFEKNAQSRFPGGSKQILKDWREARQERRQFKDVGSDKEHHDVYKPEPFSEEIHIPEPQIEEPKEGEEKERKKIPQWLLKQINDEETKRQVEHELFVEGKNAGLIANKHGFDNPFLVQHSRRTEASKEEKILLLQQLQEELGRIPTSRDLNKKKSLPSSGAYIKEFGSWNESLKAANINVLNKSPSQIDKNFQVGNIPSEREIQRLREERWEAENPGDQERRTKKWRAENPDKVKDYNKKYYEEHAEELIENAKNNYEKRKQLKEEVSPEVGEVLPEVSEEPQIEEPKEEEEKDMAVIKRTGILNVDYPRDYKGIKATLITKMPPEKVFGILKELYTEKSKARGDKEAIKQFESQDIDTFARHGLGGIYEEDVKKKMEMLKRGEDVHTGAIFVGKNEKGQPTVIHEGLGGIEATRRLGEPMVPIVFAKERDFKSTGLMQGDWIYSDAELKGMKDEEDRTVIEQTGENTFSSKQLKPGKDWGTKYEGDYEDKPKFNEWKEIGQTDLIPDEFNPKPKEDTTSEDAILYHGTPKVNITKIKREGLKPHANYWGNPAVFLTPNREMAGKYGHVLEIYVPDKELEDMGYVDLTPKGFPYKQVRIERTIHPGDIS